MKKLSRLALTFALLTVFATGIAADFAQSNDKFDVSGEWQCHVALSAGSGSPVFAFKQEGEKLTGTYKGQLGESPLVGTVKGNQISFSFKVSGAFEGTVTYTGTIESKDSMKGQAEYGDAASGTWTATRK